eukprot:s6045_g2.t1
MAGQRPPVERRLAEKVDFLLVNVEVAVLEHQAARLRRWSESQRSVLERALQVEQAAATKTESLASTVMDHLHTQVSDQQEERRCSTTAAKKAKEDCDEAFCRELRSFAAGREKLGQRLARQQLARLGAAFDQAMASKWQHLEELLQRNLWRHHVEAHRRSGRVAGARVEDLQQIWETGELEGHLSTEKQGWMRSQRADLDHLQVEADTELNEALKDLEQAIQASAPSRLLGAPGGEDPEPLQQLRSVAEAARQKLEGLAGELRSRYMPKLEEAWKACEADYSRLDREVRDFHLESLQRRFKDMESLRDLKLQLCRWRLEYQDAYHRGCADDGGVAADARQLQQRFDVARRLVRQLWRTPVCLACRFEFRLEGLPCGAAAPGGTAAGPPCAFTRAAELLAPRGTVAVRLAGAHVP